MNLTPNIIEYENLARVNAPFFESYGIAFDKTLRSGWYILGENVSAFEKEFSGYLDVSNTVGVASGLDALLLGIKVFDFPAGSEIIVPSNTYIATILAIIQSGHKPVLVEPDVHSYNLDPRKIEEKINDNTRMIMPVHLYGKCCDMDSIIPIAKKYNLRILEDCAQAHGAMLHGKKAGTFGEVAAFSFYPTKNLGALGDGGAITTSDAGLAEKLRYLRNYGSNKKYFNKYIGYNSRLDEMQAAFLSIKLEKLDQINAHKRKLATLYLKYLDRNKFILPEVAEGYHDVYHIFCILCKSRDKLKKYMEENRIKTEIHYPVPPHKQEAYQHFLNGEFPISENIHDMELSLPISTCHSEEDIMKVIGVMNNYSI